ncbi:MAG TPA: hypothetical protein DCO82_09235 [Alphaproteobacteria bacterium]|nr:hypothetical protein [Alphaproteobacteria bacterium]
MSNYVVFETPGDIDMRAIRTFGINSKPHTDNPIGYFGTGLKYAIAVLMRTGHTLTINSNGASYRFELRGERFREKHFDFIFMNGDPLPFTTELGKNWELWQAFREIYSNTIDENGEAFVSECPPSTKQATTQIVVDGADFVREFDERYNTFLRGGERSGRGVQIIRAASNHIFYRGMRVHDLKKPSLHTYNILDVIDLTEDRTAKYQFQIEARIMRALAAHHDPEIIKIALQANDDKFEAGLDFTDVWQDPTKEFVECVKTARNQTAIKYVRKRDPSWLQARSARHVFDQLADCIREDEWDLFTTIARQNSAPLLALLLAADRRTAPTESDELAGGE